MEPFGVFGIQLVLPIAVQFFADQNTLSFGNGIFAIDFGELF